MSQVFEYLKRRFSHVVAHLAMQFDHGIKIYTELQGQ